MENEVKCLATSPKKPKVRFVDLASFSIDQMQMNHFSSAEERLEAISEVANDVPLERFKAVVPMSFRMQAIAALTFGLGVPGFGICGPLFLFFLYYCYGFSAVAVALSFLVPLAFLPYSFEDENLKLDRYRSLLQYFSFRGVYMDGHIPCVKDKPYILVAPPHGVFPYGNLATMVAWPELMGFSFNGLAASAVFHTPVFRQILGGMGAIDAGRKSAGTALAAGRTIGISSGGVAEIFETNSASGEEVIVLSNRKGLVKLALRHGAAIVPCFLYGNNDCLSLWYDPFGILCAISRFLGFALILFWGRWGLPVPFRVPILGAVGMPIEIPKADGEPKQADIEKFHKELLTGMNELFDATKGYYGWDHKKLVIR